MTFTGGSELSHGVAGCSVTHQHSTREGPWFMITSERPIDRGPFRRTPFQDPQVMSHRSGRTALIAVLASAALASSLTGSVSLGADPAKDVVAGARVDWRQPWQGQESGSGDTAATAVSSPATAEQAKGVVLIDTALPYQNASGAGTGMVLTASGEVLTSYHVVKGASTIKVTDAETGNTYQATVVGSDQTDDVALLQLQGASGLTSIKIDNDQASVGDKVTAVGNAGGTGTLSAAKGTVLSLQASITTAAEGPVPSETLTGMIETTADVVSGDSGGPLYDADGETIGIDTAASSGSEINGYATPIQRALSIVQQIQSGKESSTVQVGPAAFLGVELGDASSDSGYPGAGFQESSGAVIESIVSGSAADVAGLAAGDEITGLDGQAVTSPDDVTAVLADHDPGDQVKIMWSDQYGSDHSATVTLGASPVA
jgi:S1-C subfamily serine protease